MILLIDNYDSFTFNLARYLVEIGQEVRVVKNDAIDLDEIETIAPSAMVFSPGPCTPNESGITLEAINRFHPQIPMLGVCLGHQAIAQSFGGKVVRAKSAMHGKVSSIRHNARGLFANLPTRYKVTRYHSLVVDQHHLPAHFEITAWTEDDNGALDEIMAIQHKFLPIYGVQFHPESLLTEHGHKLLQNFIS
ncbi:anthranilate synthase component II [Alteromonas sp. a30]|uniref:anthranilate synthase component II n=1 Tax=Alteromonas sp. a30 TaxID=2730917 RepID=UPI00227F434C|nr:aminodeoxychorismate/anthranilate synthase component II [Alteromonas sp. a30]MCY7295312.1 aminodeoxychorismate/anthranilate synthase component II [Alteromonas sp. a30]